jgi:hypothetical protein
MTPDPDLVHVTQEMVITEGEFVRGTSLWRDAWRRLLKNKLAVFGLIVVVLITLASLLGPTVIKRTTGFTPDYIPTEDTRLIRSFPPFTGPNGEFSCGRIRWALITRAGISLRVCFRAGRSRYSSASFRRSFRC